MIVLTGAGTNLLTGAGHLVEVQFDAECVVFEAIVRRFACLTQTTGAGGRFALKTATGHTDESARAVKVMVALCARCGAYVFTVLRTAQLPPTFIPTAPTIAVGLADLDLKAVFITIAVNCG